jgi:L-lactate dehydrogenase complex protein LldG
MTTEKTVSARDEVLQRIRVAIGTSDAATARNEWSALSRGYKSSGTRNPNAVLELLEDRLRDYDAQVVRSTPADVARSVAGMLSARGKQRLVVPPGLPMEWLPAGFTFVLDQSMTPAELDGFVGVMTGSTVAIAETGTVATADIEMTRIQGVHGPRVLDVILIV